MRALLATLVILGAGGCAVLDAFGGGGGGGPDGAATTGADGAAADAAEPDGATADAGEPDAAPPIDGPTADAAPCLVEADLGDLGEVEGSHTKSTSGHMWQARINDDEYADAVYIELRNNRGVFEGDMVKTGTFVLEGAELNYRTCGACVLVFGDAPPGGGQVEWTWMATGGTLEVTQLTPKAAGRLHDATFTQVAIDPFTWDSIPLANGCDTSIDFLHWKSK
jgi:hypothetical protein